MPSPGRSGINQQTSFWYLPAFKGKDLQISFLHSAQSHDVSNCATTKSDPALTIRFPSNFLFNIKLFCVLVDHLSYLSPGLMQIFYLSNLQYLRHLIFCLHYQECLPLSDEIKKYRKVGQLQTTGATLASVREMLLMHFPRKTPELHLPLVFCIVR